MKTLLALAGCALAIAAAGCGERQDRDVLRFLEQADNGGGWAEIIRRFEEDHPGVRVELVEGPPATDAREALYSTSFLSGDRTYDLVFMDVIWVPKFAAQGWLMPLDDRFPPERREEFLPGDIAGSIYQQRIYRVPMRSDAGLLFYRSDIVENPPETFDELSAACRLHQSPPELWGFAFQGRQYEGLVCAFLEVLWGHGGDVLDSNGRVILDSPEAVAALRWLAGAVGTIAPPAVATYQEEESRYAFQEGRAIFLRNWPYVWSKAQESGSPIRGKVGIVPMVHLPGREAAATLGGWGFGIAAGCRNPDLAWRFIEFATGEEGMKILNRMNGSIPARRSLYSDSEIVASHPHYPELFEALLRARPRPVHPRYAAISSAIQVHVSSALVGRETPEQALDRAAEEIRSVLGTSR